MSLLEVEGLKFKYGALELYNSVSFRILPQEHIVLVGENGSGKSTFMKLIAGNLIADSGKITWLNNVRFGYLDQHLQVEKNQTIKSYLLDAYADLYAKENQMTNYYDKLTSCAEWEYEKYLNYAQSLQEELEKSDFYKIDSNIKSLLNGLGIEDVERNLAQLSGGQRAKVYLAKLLLDAPDVLLMDEPTNFLDAAHIEWLAKYLKNFANAFVVISHDEAFLKAIGKVVYSLDHSTLTKYKMDYEHYLEEKAVREQQYESAYQNQQKFIKKTEVFIQKNIARASTSKQAKSRRKMLEKLQILDRPTSHTPMNLNFPFAKELGQEVLKLDNLTVGYEGKPILNNLNFLLKHNQKVAILGRNGVGKSTILKTIVKILKPLGGSYTWNPSVSINYFAQEEDYPSDANALSYLRRFYHDATDEKLRSILAKAGLKGDLVVKPLKNLSGGQLTKVRLALMSMKKSNVLIFDEPTNHLDVFSKAELYESIERFAGSVILVTHEKDFYEDLVDIVLDFGEGVLEG